MSLFGSKKKTTSSTIPSKGAVDVRNKVLEVKETKVVRPTKAKKVEKAVAVVATSTAPITVLNNLAGAILRPRITEKSGLLSQGGVYTFEVAKNANKNSVAQAIKTLYKVIPVRVAILNNPAKNVFVRGRRGVVPGVRKALVTLKKGEKIDFV